MANGVFNPDKPENIKSTQASLDELTEAALRKSRQDQMEPFRTEPISLDELTEAALRKSRQDKGELTIQEVDQDKVRPDFDNEQIADPPDLQFAVDTMNNLAQDFPMRQNRQEYGEEDSFVKSFVSQALAAREEVTVGLSNVPGMILDYYNQSSPLMDYVRLQGKRNGWDDETIDQAVEDVYGEVQDVYEPIDKFFTHNRFVENRRKRIEEFEKNIIKYDKTMTGYIGNREWGKAAGRMAHELVRTLPIMVATMSATFLGTPMAGVAVAGSIAGGQKREDLKEVEDMQETKKAINAVLTGVAEGAFARIGTVGLASMGKKLFSEVGKESAEHILRRSFSQSMRRLLKNTYGLTGGVQEAIEEGATQFSENLVDRYTGLDPHRNPWDGVWDAMLLGFAAGQGIGGGISQGARMNQRFHENYKRKERKADREGIEDEGPMDPVDYHNKWGGATFDVDGNHYTGKGFISAISPETTKRIAGSRLRQSDIDEYAKSNRSLLAQDGNYIGTWYNTKTGNTELDIVKVFEKRQEALEYARNNNHTAIYDMKKEKDIATGKSGLPEGETEIEIQERERLETVEAIRRTVEEVSLMNGLSESEAKRRGDRAAKAFEETQVVQEKKKQLRKKSLERTRVRVGEDRKVKVKSRLTREGTMMNASLEVDGVDAGTAVLSKTQDGNFQLTHVRMNEKLYKPGQKEERLKGKYIGTAAYIRLNQATERRGGVLESSPADLRSANAERVWQSLVDMDLAEKVGDRYRFIPTREFTGKQLGIKFEEVTTNLKLDEALQKARKQGKDLTLAEAKKIRQSFEQFIKENSKEINRLGRLSTAMLRAVNNIRPNETGWRDVERAVDYFKGLFAKKQKQRIEEHRSILRTEVERLLDPKTWRKKGSKITKAKESAPDVATQDMLMEIRKKALEGNWMDAQQRIYEIQKTIEEKGNELSSEELEQLYSEMDLLKFQGVEEMPLEQLEYIAEELEIINNTGKAIHKQQTNKFNQEMDALVKDVVNRITPEGSKIELTPEEDLQIRQANKRARGPFGGVFDAPLNSSWLSLLDKLQRYDETAKNAMDGHLIRTFGSLVKNARRVEDRGKREVLTMVHDKLLDLYGGKKRSNRKVLKALNSNKDEAVDRITYKTTDPVTGEEIEQTLPGIYNQNIAYYVWQKWQDETLHPTMLEQGFTQEGIDALEKYMKPEVLEFAQWQINKLFPYLKARYNRTYRNMFGMNMPGVDNFSPLVRKVAGNQDKAEEQLLGSQGAVITANNGSLYSRVNSKAPLRLVDGDKILFSYIDRMEFFNAWAEPVRILRKVFTDERVRTSIKKYHGSRYIKAIDHKLNQFVDAPELRATKIQGVDMVRKLFTKASLALKPTVFLKQLGSYPAYLTFVPPKDLMEGTAHFMMNAVEAYNFLKDTEFMRSRYGKGTIDRDIALALRQDYVKQLAGKKHMNITDWFMFNVKWGDKIPILAGGWSVYRYHYKKAKAEGLSDEQAKDRGLQEFEFASSQTQQSSEVEDLSYWQTANSFSKIMTMYMTAPMQYHRMASSALRRVFQGKKVGRNLGVFGIYHVLLPSLFQLAANGFKWKDDDQLRAALMGNFNSIFAIGDAVEFVIDKSVYQRPWDYQISPLASLVSETADFVSGVLDIKNSTPEEVYETIAAGAEVASHLFGVPLPGLLNTGEGIYRAAKGKSEHPVREIIGFDEDAMKDGVEVWDIFDEDARKKGGPVYR